MLLHVDCSPRAQNMSMLTAELEKYTKQEKERTAEEDASTGASLGTSQEQKLA